MQHSPDELTSLQENLVSGEQSLRDAEIRKAFKTYQHVADGFEKLSDFETASYFHKRCLDISIEYKYLEGEARAYRGLGIAEEKVMNKE